MKKPLTTLFALTFVLLFGLVNVASAMKHEMPAGKTEMKKEQKADKAVIKACKDKKAGDVVMIKDKEVTCPEKKKMKKKSTAPAAPAPAK